MSEGEILNGSNDMDKKLINTFPFEIGGIEQICVNARELHAFLEVGKDFSTWIKQRIEECGYKENQDFRIFPQNWGKINPQPNQKVKPEGPGRGRPAKEYIITLDMAKELCMIERNPKGRIARRYFIEMEKRARASEKVQRALLALSSTELPQDTATCILFFRSYGLTQAEAAKALNITRSQVQTFERKLREAGISIPAVIMNKRTREWRERLPELLTRLARIQWAKEAKAIAGDMIGAPREALPC